MNWKWIINYIPFYLVLIIRYIITYNSGYILPDEALYYNYLLTSLENSKFTFYNVTRSGMAIIQYYYLYLLNVRDISGVILAMAIFQFGQLTILLYLFRRVVSKISPNKNYNLVLFTAPIFIVVFPFNLTEGFSLLFVLIFILYGFNYLKSNHIKNLYYVLITCIFIPFTRETSLIFVVFCIFFLINSYLGKEYNNDKKNFIFLIFMGVISGVIVGFGVLVMNIDLKLLLSPSFPFMGVFSLVVDILLSFVIGVGPIIFFGIILFLNFFIKNRKEMKQEDWFVFWLIVGGFCSYLIPIYLVVIVPGYVLGSQYSFFARLSIYNTVSGFLGTVYMIERMNSKIYKYFIKNVKIIKRYVVVIFIILILLISILTPQLLILLQSNLTNEQFLSDQNIEYSGYERISMDYVSPWKLLRDYFGNMNGNILLYVFEGYSIRAELFLFDLGNIEIIDVGSISGFDLNSTDDNYRYYFFGEIDGNLMERLSNYGLIEGYFYENKYTDLIEEIWLNFESFLLNVCCPLN